MKTKIATEKAGKIKFYKTVEEAFDAKHESAKKFISKIDIAKVASL